MTACTGVIMAGGRALRFDGRPKGLEPVGGVRIIDRVADALRATCDDLLLVANHPDAASWLPGVRAVADVLPDQGSLGGIHAALSHARGAVLVVAWDMPFVPPALLHRLCDLGEHADVVVPESGSRRGVEPMCAFYGPACLGAIEARLRAGDRRVISFFDDVRVTSLPAAQVATFGDPSFLFLNVNTPDDLRRADSHATAADHRRPQA